MKKNICLLLVLCFTLLLCACGSKEGASNQISEVVDDADKTIEKGEKISTPDYEITLAGVSVGPTVYAPEGFWKGGKASYEYEAAVFLTVKNLQKNSIRIGTSQHSDIYCIARIDYNDGYIYEAEEIFIDGYLKRGVNEIAPLDEAKLYYRFRVPEEVSSNLDVPLYAIIEMGDGTRYRYEVSEYVIKLS